jgi:RNA polymerase sigma factor (sigma-70 family)
MPQPLFADVLRFLRKTCELEAARELPDEELLERFAAARDEAAFNVLVRRHGPMVLSVCHRVLEDVHLAEDGFQATFMVLVRRAAGLGKRQPLAGWLYGVARRVALKARARAARARQEERGVEPMQSNEPLDELTWQELRAVLDEEIGRLPQKFQLPLVLCHLEGRSHADAAKELDCPKRSLTNRLERGRELLRLRLIRRGITLSAGALAVGLSEKVGGTALGAMLAIKTVKAAMCLGAGKAVAAGLLSSQAAALAEKTIAGMMVAKCKLTGLVAILVLAVAGAGAAGISSLAGVPERAIGEHAQTPTPKAGNQAVPKKLTPIPVGANEAPLPVGALMRLGSTRLRHGQAVTGLAFASDGKVLVSSSWDRTVSLWEMPSGKEIRRFEGFDGFVLSVAITPDGKIIAAGSDRDFRLLDASTGKELFRLPAGGNVPSVAFSPDGLLAAFAAPNPGGAGVHIVEAGTGKPSLKIDAQATMVGAVAFAPDGKTLAFADDKSVRLRDTATGAETARLESAAGALTTLCFSCDGKKLAASGAEPVARIYDLATAKEIQKINVPVSAGVNVTGLAFSPDGKQLAACTGLQGRLVQVFDLASGFATNSFNGGWFRCITFSPDGKMLAAGDGDGPIRLWAMPSGKVIDPAPPHQGGVHSIALSPDGNTLVAGTYRSVLHLWDIETGKLVRQMKGHPRSVYPSAYSPDGQRVASGSRDGTARVWDVATGKELRTFLGYDEANKKGDVWVYALSFSPDGHRLAGGCMDGLVRIWDLDSGAELARCKTTNLVPVWGVAFAPDGKTLASCGRNQAVHLWDAASGMLQKVMGEPGLYESIAFSPDGQLVATSLRGRGVVLFDMASGMTLRTLKEHANAAFRVSLFADGRTLAFSPNGRTVASGSWQVVQLWEVATGKERFAFPAHRGEVTSVQFFPDGRRLATASPDTTIAVWDLPTCVLASDVGAGKSTEQQLEKLWTELAGEDAAASYRALWALSRVPEKVLPLLRQRLKPAVLPKGEQFERLLADLDDNDFSIREKASAELAKSGDAAEPALKAALKNKVSLEVKLRVEELLAKMRTWSRQRVQEARALEVLENLGTAEARDLLRELSQGTAGMWLTEEAKAVLKRAREK